MAGRNSEFASVNDMEPKLLPLLKMAYDMAKGNPEIAEGLRKLDFEGQLVSLLFHQRGSTMHALSNAA